MNEIFKLFGSIGVKTDEAEAGLDKVHGKGESTAGGMLGFFKKAAIGIGALWAGGKVIDFAKTTVEASAESQAVRSQYEQVFGDLSGKADSMSTDMAKTFGMIPEQLRPGMVKFQSMFKGVGIDSKKSLDMTKEATQAAADASKFANKSFDEAQGAIQSFILGNYEAGDAIGVQANDNAIAQYAIQQGAVKTTAEWQKMGDAQKEQMRLGYITHVQKLSGVTGQAARESQSYEAVTEKLAAVWQKFLATVGAPILAAVLPILSKVTDVMGFLTGTTTDASGKTTALSRAFSQLIDAFKFAGNMISNVLQPVWDIFFSGMGGKAEGALTGIVNGFRNFFIQVGNFFIVYGAPIQNTLVSLFDGVSAAWGVIFGVLRQIINAFFQYVVPYIRQVLGQILTFWNQNGKQIMQAVSVVFNAIKAVIGAVMPAVMGIIKNTWNSIKGIIDGTLKVIMGIIKVFTGILTGDWRQVWNGIKDITSGVWKVISSIIGGAFNNIKGVINAGNAAVRSIISSGLSVVGRLFSAPFEAGKNAISNAMRAASDAVSNGINWIKGLFNFQISWPHIPLPHFRASGSANPLDWIKGKGIPSIGIDWYAKGGIMTNPTAFGMNGNDLMVGGEAGKEAVLPLNRTNLGMIGEGIAATMGNDAKDAAIIEAIRQMAERIVQAVLANKDVNIDGRALTDYIETQIMKGITV